MVRKHMTAVYNKHSQGEKLMRTFWYFMLASACELQSVRAQAGVPAGFPARPAGIYCSVDRAKNILLCDPNATAVSASWDSLSGSPVDIHVEVTEVDELAFVEVPGFRIFVQLKPRTGSFFELWSWKDSSQMIAANLVAIAVMLSITVVLIVIQIKYTCIGKSAIKKLRNDMEIAKEVMSTLKTVAGPEEGAQVVGDGAVQAGLLSAPGGKPGKKGKKKMGKKKKGKSGKKGAKENWQAAGDAALMSGADGNTPNGQRMGAEDAVLAMMMLNENNPGQAPQGPMAKLRMMASLMKGEGQMSEQLNGLMGVMNGGQQGAGGLPFGAQNSAYMNPMLSEASDLEAQFKEGGLEGVGTSIAEKGESKVMGQVHSTVETVAKAQFGEEAGTAVAERTNAEIDVKENVAKQQVQTRVKKKKKGGASAAAQPVMNPMREG